MHIHRLVWVKRTPEVKCEDCGLRLRLALREEAIFVQNHNAYGPDGPMVFGEHGAIVVPLNFTMSEVS